MRVFVSGSIAARPRGLGHLQARDELRGVLVDFILDLLLTSLLLVCAFDAPSNAVTSAFVQPHHRLLNLGERDGVLAAGVGSGLETGEAIFDDSEQGFATDAIYPCFLDRSILETNMGMNGDTGWKFGHSLVNADDVGVMSAPLARFVGDVDG